MRRGLLVLVALASACSQSGLEYEGEPGRPTPAVFTRGVPAVTASVAGAGAGRFLVDTGAPFTVLDTDAYPDFADGRHVASLEAFELTFPALDVLAFDVFPGDQVGSAFAGIIGGDVLSRFALTIDYREPRIWLRERWDGALPDGLAPGAVGPTSQIEARVRGGGRVLVPGDCPGGCGTVRVDPSRFLVEVALEGEPTAALVDTGASEVILDPALLERLGDGGRPRLDGVTVATASGPADAYFTRVGRMSLEAREGELARRSVAALVIPEAAFFESLEAEVGRPVGAVLGAGFLRRYLSTVDYPGRRLVLEPYASTDHIDPDQFVRVGFTLERGPDDSWLVRDVFPGTDAAADGLREGETIASIDGTELAPLDFGEVDALLGGFALGEDVPVGVERDAGVETLAIAVEDLLPPFEAP